MKLDRVEFEAGTSRPTTSFVTVLFSGRYLDDDEMIRKRCGVMVVTVNKEKKIKRAKILPNLCWLRFLRLFKYDKKPSLSPKSLLAIIKVYSCGSTPLRVKRCESSSPLLLHILLLCLPCVFRDALPEKRGCFQNSSKYLLFLYHGNESAPSISVDKLAMYVPTYVRKYVLATILKNI